MAVKHLPRFAVSFARTGVREWGDPRRRPERALDAEEPSRGGGRLWASEGRALHDPRARARASPAFLEYIACPSPP